MQKSASRANRQALSLSLFLALLCFMFVLAGSIFLWNRPEYTSEPRKLESSAMQLAPFLRSLELTREQVESSFLEHRTQMQADAERTILDEQRQRSEWVVNALAAQVGLAHLRFGEGKSQKEGGIPPSARMFIEQIAKDFLLGQQLISLAFETAEARTVVSLAPDGSSPLLAREPARKDFISKNIEVGQVVFEELKETAGLRLVARKQDVANGVAIEAVALVTKARADAPLAALQAQVYKLITGVATDMAGPFSSLSSTADLSATIGGIKYRSVWLGGAAGLSAVGIFLLLAAFWMKRADRLVQQEDCAVQQEDCLVQSEVKTSPLVDEAKALGAFDEYFVALLRSIALLDDQALVASLPRTTVREELRYWSLHENDSMKSSRHAFDISAVVVSEVDLANELIELVQKTIEQKMDLTVNAMRCLERRAVVFVPRIGDQTFQNSLVVMPSRILNPFETNVLASMLVEDRRLECGGTFIWHGGSKSFPLACATQLQAEGVEPLFVSALSHATKQALDVFQKNFEHAPTHFSAQTAMERLSALVNQASRDQIKLHATILAFDPDVHKVYTATSDCT